MRLFKLTTVFVLVLSLFTFATAGDDKEVKHAKSIQIILNTSETGANVKENMNNLPVLIKLDKDNFDFGVLKEGLAGDITVSVSEGSFLTYKVKSFDKSGKTAEIWVIVPKVSGENSTQALTLSYGKDIASITDEKMKEEVEKKKGI